MKYVKLFLTLIFFAFGAILYFNNKDWMDGELVLNFSVPRLYEITPATTSAGIAVAAAFLLGMIFALIYSSLNWIELIQSRRKIRRLESSVEEREKEEE